MATAAITRTQQTWHRFYTWAEVAQGDDFAAATIEVTPYTMMMQVDGTPDGATIAIHGSIDGVTYYPLDDAEGTAIGLTAAGLVSIGEAPYYIKPVLTGGGASTALTVQIYVRADKM